jgi:hypothetical protein
MMTGVKRLATIAIVVCAWPHQLAAQIPPPSDEPAPIQVGPLGLYPTVALRDVGVDSNVFNDAVDPKEDFTYTVNLRLVAALRARAARLSGSVVENFVYFNKYKDEQSVNGAYGLRLDLTAGRFRPFASADHAKTRERPSPEIDTRARRTEQAASAGLDVELTGMTALTASVRRAETAYEEGEEFRGVDLAGELNRVGRSASFGLKLFVTPFTTLALAAETLQERFPGSHLRDADSIRFVPTLEFSSDAAISGRAGAGYRDFKPTNPALPEYRGLVASVGVVYRLRDVTTFNVQASRDVGYSYDETQPYYLMTDGGVTITQRVVGPFDLIVSGQRQHLAYRALGDPVQEAAGRTDTVSIIGGGLGFRVRQNVRVTVTGERTERRSTAPGALGYQRTRLLGSLALGS